uniref:Peptidase A2 domain-containing protein n=1 Tax=Heligmosomoides polygyrus TaxID=6339 RepID=A0A183GLD5_HELPZ
LLVEKQQELREAQQRAEQAERACARAPESPQADKGRYIPEWALAAAELERLDRAECEQFLRRPMNPSEVVIGDRTWKALLDTGSEISIMPVGVYNDADVALTEGGRAAVARRSEHNEDKSATVDPAQDLNEEQSPMKEMADDIQNGNKAVVCKRAYVSPGQTKTVAVQGRVDENGVTYVRVQNHSEGPVVLRAGQEVGEFEDETEYAKLNEAHDVDWSSDDHDGVDSITSSCSSDEVAVCDGREITSNMVG